MAVSLLAHGVARALQIGGTQFIVASVVCGLLLCRRGICRTAVRNVRIGGRRIASVVVERIENRYGQKYLAVRPRIAKAAQRAMDTDGALRRLHPKRQLSR